MRGTRSRRYSDSHRIEELCTYCPKPVAVTKNGKKLKVCEYHREWRNTLRRKEYAEKVGEVREYNKSDPGKL